jgi:hypothetical protein
VTVKSDDSGLLNRTFALTAESSFQGATNTSNTLTQAQVTTTAQEAVREWIAAVGAGQAAALNKVTYILVNDLPGDALAWDIGDGIVLIDMSAAGFGWFVDPTPYESSEFRGTGDVLTALPGTAAAGHMDLLTAISHELGHILGYSHGDSSLMSETLAAGQRKLEDANAANSSFDIALFGASGGAGSVAGTPSIDWDVDFSSAASGWNFTGKRQKSAWFSEFVLDEADPQASSVSHDQIEWFIEV